MVGWRQLKDGLKPACMLVFLISNIFLYPRLYPRFAFGTPVIETIAPVSPPAAPDYLPHAQLVFMASESPLF